MVAAGAGAGVDTDAGTGARTAGVAVGAGAGAATGAVTTGGCANAGAVLALGLLLVLALALVLLLGTVWRWRWLALALQMRSIMGSTPGHHTTKSGLTLQGPGSFFALNSASLNLHWSFRANSANAPQHNSSSRKGRRQKLLILVGARPDSQQRPLT